jgi:hypothetical protein
MSNMPNWLVPEDDRTIPTGALWRQWLNTEVILNAISELFHFSFGVISHWLLIFFRSPKDFASASDKIWPHFAALKLTRTHKWELVDKGVIKKVFVIAIDTKEMLSKP